MKLNSLFIALALCCAVVFNSCEDDPTCTDGLQNQGELGIDCGGPCPAICGATATCTDGIMNGDEEDIDCGGSCPDACTTTATCTDGLMNGNETGIDCGGPDCPACTSTCAAPVNNATSYVLDGANVAGDIVTTTTPGGGVSITAVTLADNSNLQFTLNASAPGTYNLNSIEVPALIYSVNNVQTHGSPIGGGTGTITVTTYTNTASCKHLQGTFNFTLTGNGADKAFTNGTFNVDFN